MCWAIASFVCLVLLQKSQGMETPSKWLHSMWSHMWWESPSLPQILQIHDIVRLGVPSAYLPCWIVFWPFSIIDLTLWSSNWRSVLDWSGIVTAVKVLGETFSCWWACGFLEILFLLWTGSETWVSSFSLIKSTEICLVRSFSWISSAMATKESKSFW